jgi:GT2 family glycosyltransferase
VNQPLVSVLIAAHNAEQWIDATIQSVLEQSWRRLQLIVVDDGSTDGTRSLLERYEANGALRLIVQANTGQCAARNRAFRECSGDFVKFLDADDLLSPTCIELQVARLLEHPNCIASAEWGRFYGDPSQARFVPEDDVWEDLDGITWLVRSWSNGGGMSQAGMFLLPRPLLQRVGGWDERLTFIEDFEFFARVMLGSDGVLFTRNARLYYRSGLPSSVSRRKSRRAAESAHLSFTLGAAQLLAKENSARTRRACATMFQSFVYQYYPDYSDLLSDMERRAAQLGGSPIGPNGPPGFQVMRRLVGWRLARRIEKAAVQTGVNRAGLQRRYAAARSLLNR